MRWEEFSLDEIGVVARGKSKHRPRDAAHLYDGPYPFIQTGDVKHSNLYITSYSQTYSEEGLKQSKLWQKGTLCITIAANIADTAILDIDACFPDSVIGFIPDETKCDVKYIKYKFDLLQSQFKQFSQGAAQDNLSLGKLVSIKFALPPLPIQKKIAAILSGYDDLIENNLKRIALLEKSARLLYEEWFVRLRFHGYEHANIVDGVPEGWEKVRLKEFGEVITGKTPSTKDESNFGDQVPFIKTPDMHNNVFVLETETMLSEKGANLQSKKYIPANSLTVSCIGTLGVVSITSRVSQTNQQINAVVPIEDSYLYYCYYSFKNLKERLEAIGGGATMGNVNKSKFENLDIIKPTDTLLRDFHSICEGIFQQIKNLQLQNQKLKQARDILLPKLINGEIAV
jgi:type I restriction enzyme, S subunit